MPEPVNMPLDGPCVLGCGTEGNNAFCITSGKKAYVSPNNGDLTHYANYKAYLDSINELSALLKVQPETAAHDMHPDYVTTRYARQSAFEKLTAVQHHHAHIAACMTEHNLNETVIGIALDGMGLGDDGTLWGGEFLTANLADYKRACHFKQYHLPGGDQATIHPHRMALSCLLTEFDDDGKTAKRVLPAIDSETHRIIRHMIENKLRSPLTSSAGRLFDIVSAMLGLCGDEIAHPGEPAINLQNAAAEDTDFVYPFDISNGILDFGPMIRQIVSDIDNCTDKGRISSAFHNTVASAAAAVCDKIRSAEGIKKVVLSGGVFQNVRLLNLMTRMLDETGFETYSHFLLPPSDISIALGQAAVALARRAGKN